MAFAILLEGEILKKMVILDGGLIKEYLKKYLHLKVNLYQVAF